MEEIWDFLQILSISSVKMKQMDEIGDFRHSNILNFRRFENVKQMEEIKQNTVRTVISFCK